MFGIKYSISWMNKILKLRRNNSPLKSLFPDKVLLFLRFIRILENAYSK